MHGAQLSRGARARNEWQHRSSWRCQSLSRVQPHSRKITSGGWPRAMCPACEYFSRTGAACTMVRLEVRLELWNRAFAQACIPSSSISSRSMASWRLDIGAARSPSPCHPPNLTCVHARCYHCHHAGCCGESAQGNCAVCCSEQMDSSTAPCDNDLRAPVTEMARTRRPGSPSRAATLPRPPSRRPHRPPLPLQPPALPFAAMGAASPAADGRVQTGNAQNATSEVGYLAFSQSTRCTRWRWRRFSSAFLVHRRSERHVLGRRHIDGGHMRARPSAPAALRHLQPYLLVGRTCTPGTTVSRVASLAGLVAIYRPVLAFWQSDRKCRLKGNLSGPMKTGVGPGGPHPMAVS